MDTIPDVISLAERKMKLLATCDVQREMLALEWRALRYRCSTFKGVTTYLPKLALIVFPLIGFLTARKARRTEKGGVLTKGWLLWAVARRGWKAWKLLKRS